MPESESPKARVVSPSEGSKARVTSVLDAGRARVIQSSENPRATVVSINEASWVPAIGNPSAEDAAGFVSRYREAANPPEGFMRRDIAEMVQSAGVAPVRFVYEERSKAAGGESIGHWMLYVGSSDAEGRIAVYDPERGVRDISTGDERYEVYDFPFNNDDEAQWGEPTVTKAASQGKVRVASVSKKELLNPPPEEAYSLNQDVLRDLGPTQRTAVDCGPLCVYAAAVARNSA